MKKDMYKSAYDKKEAERYEIHWDDYKPDVRDKLKLHLADCDYMPVTNYNGYNNYSGDD